MRDRPSFRRRIVGISVSTQRITRFGFNRFPGSQVQKGFSLQRRLLPSPTYASSGLIWRPLPVHSGGTAPDLHRPSLKGPFGHLKPLLN